MLKISRILKIMHTDSCIGLDLPQVGFSLWFVERAVKIVMTSAPCVDSLTVLGDRCKDWASLAPAA